MRLIRDSEPGDMIARGEPVKIRVGDAREVMTLLMDGIGEHSSSIADKLRYGDVDSVISRAEIVDAFVEIVERVNAVGARLGSVGINAETVQSAGMRFRQEFGGYTKGYIADVRGDEVAEAPTNNVVNLRRE